MKLSHINLVQTTNQIDDLILSGRAKSGFFSSYYRLRIISRSSEGMMICLLTHRTPVQKARQGFRNKLCHNHDPSMNYYHHFFLSETADCKKDITTNKTTTSKRLASNSHGEIAREQTSTLAGSDRAWAHVPWTGTEATLGLVAVVVSFLAVGLAIIPLTRSIIGPDAFQALGSQEKATLLLLNQIAETTIGLMILWSITKKYRPLPTDILNFNLKEPFRKPNGWALWGIVGITVSPALVYLASVISAAIGLEDPAAPGTADAVSTMLGPDPITLVSVFTTTAVLAPLLEETTFRGFLLPSLTKVMPTSAAILVSSFVFGFAHLSPRDTPQLSVLGILLSITYLRSKNLLTPIAIHGFWNGSVLLVLCFLQSQGVDLQKLLHESVH